MGVTRTFVKSVATGYFPQGAFLVTLFATLCEDARWTRSSRRPGTPCQTFLSTSGGLLIGGIVRRRRAGKTVLYSIADDTIESQCDIVCASVRKRAEVMSD